MTGCSFIQTLVLFRPPPTKRQSSLAPDKGTAREASAQCTLRAQAHRAQRGGARRTGRDRGPSKAKGQRTQLGASTKGGERGSRHLGTLHRGNLDGLVPFWRAIFNMRSIFTSPSIRAHLSVPPHKQPALEVRKSAASKREPGICSRCGMSTREIYVGHRIANRLIESVESKNQVATLSNRRFKV